MKKNQFLKLNRIKWKSKLAYICFTVSRKSLNLGYQHKFLIIRLNYYYLPLSLSLSFVIYLIFEVSLNPYYNSKEVVLRITRREYTCQVAGSTFVHGGNKSFQCERTVVYRESSRSGRWSSKATRDLRAGPTADAAESLLFLSLSLPFSLFFHSARSPSPDLFIPFSVAGSLSSSTSSLFLSFCPFSASANDSRLFIPRLCIAPDLSEGAFAFTRLLPSCRCVLSLLLPSILSFDPFFPSSQCLFKMRT